MSIKNNNQHQNLDFKKKFNMLDEKLAFEEDRKFIKEKNYKAPLGVSKIKDALAGLKSWSAYRLFYNSISKLSNSFSNYSFFISVLSLALIATGTMFSFIPKNNEEAKIYTISGFVFMFVFLMIDVFWVVTQFKKLLKNFYQKTMFDDNLILSEAEVSKKEILKTKTYLYLIPSKGLIRCLSDLEFLRISIDSWENNEQNKIYFKRFTGFFSYLILLIDLILFLAMWIPFVMFFPGHDYAENKFVLFAINLSVCLLFSSFSFFISNSVSCYLAMLKIQKIVKKKYQ